MWDQVLRRFDLRRSSSHARSGARWSSAGAARSCSPRRCSASKAVSTSRATPQRSRASSASCARSRTSGPALGVNVNAMRLGTSRPTTPKRCVTTPAGTAAILERIPAGRWGGPVDLAGAAVFLASAASDYVDGIVLPVDGGWLGAMSDAPQPPPAARLARRDRVGRRPRRAARARHSLPAERTCDRSDAANEAATARPSSAWPDRAS